MSNDNLAGVWTRKGLDKLAAQLAGGDGGSVPPALESMTGLLGERWRGVVNTVEIDPDSENSVIVQAVIPYNVGGWFIREWGLYDSKGDLVAYGPHAEFYKPVPSAARARSALWSPLTCWPRGSMWTRRWAGSRAWSRTYARPCPRAGN